MARWCLCLTRTLDQLVESRISSGNISQRCYKLALYCSYWCHYEQQLDDESGCSHAYKVPAATQIGLMTNISLQRPAGVTLKSLCTWDCVYVSKVSWALEAVTNWGGWSSRSASEEMKGSEMVLSSLTFTDFSSVAWPCGQCISFMWTFSIHYMPLHPAARPSAH